MRKFIWIIMSIPGGIVAAIVIGLWTDFIGGYVVANMIGAFLGIFIPFSIVQVGIWLYQAFNPITHYNRY